MPAHLGAGTASCQICVEPFGRLEDFRAPFVAACGHAFCLLCLHNDRVAPCCPLCQIPYDRDAYLRLVGIVGAVPRRRRSSELGAKLRDDVARVSELTNVMQLRTLHDEARCFLDVQPRNRFTDLDTNVRLLGQLLQTKETVQTQTALVNRLVDRVHQLSADKVHLQMQMDEAERQYAREREYVRGRVYDIIRHDPDFNLLSEEVLQFQIDINDLRQTVYALSSQIDTAAESPSQAGSPSTLPEGMAPRIRVLPASRSPSPGPLPSSSPSSALSPLAMSAIGDDFGTTHPLTQGARLAVPRNEDIARAREAVLAQIRRRRSGNLRTGGAPAAPRPAHRRSLSEDSLLSMTSVDAELSPRMSSPASLTETSSSSYYSAVGPPASPFPAAADPPTNDVQVHSPLEREAAGAAEVAAAPTHAHPDSAPASTASSVPPTPALPLLRTPPALRRARSVSRLVERLPAHLTQLLGRALADRAEGRPAAGGGSGVLDALTRVFAHVVPDAGGSGDVGTAAGSGSSSALVLYAAGVEGTVDAGHLVEVGAQGAEAEPKPEEVSAPALELEDLDAGERRDSPRAGVLESVTFASEVLD